MFIIFKKTNQNNLKKIQNITKIILFRIILFYRFVKENLTKCYEQKF